MATDRPQSTAGVDRLLGEYGVVDTDAGISLHDILRVVFRRRRIVVMAILFTTAFAAAGAYFLKPSYKAQAQLYVQREKPATLQLEGDVPGRPILTREDVINSEVSLLLSRGVVESAVDAMRLWERPGEDTLISRLKKWLKATLISVGLWTEVDPREGTIIKVQKRIKAEAEPDSDIISVWHVSDKPALSAELVNAIVDAYLAKRQESNVKSGRYEFFLAQVAQAEEERAALKAQRTSLKTEWNIVEITQEKSLTLQALALTENRLQETVGDVRKLERTQAHLAQDVADLPERLMTQTETEHSELYDELVAMLARLEAEAAEKLVRWPATDPRVLETTEAIATVRARLENVTAIVPSAETQELNPVRMALDQQEKLLAADLAGLRAKRKTFEAQHTILKQRLLALDAHEEELAKLDEAIAVATGKRATFMERAEEARIQAESGPGFTNAWIINRASVPQRPTLMRIITIVLGMLLGTVLAGLFVAAAEFFDHSVHSREDASRHLGIPVLAVVPYRRR